MSTIVRREFLAFWWNVPNCIVVGITLSISGVFFANAVTSTASANLGQPFEQSGLLLVLVVPVLTMRTLAEEARTGSLEVLLTQPVSETAIIVGKYLGLLGTGTAVLAPLTAYPVFLYRYGQPDGWVVLSSFVGLILLLALLTALGVFTSSLAASQVVAAGVGILGGLLIWSAALFERVPGQLSILTRVSALDRLRDFTSGAVETSDVVYFLTISGALLYLAVRALAARRLR